MYYIIILPLISGAIAQGLKFFIKSNKQKAKLKNLVAYSGMPSGHSALVVSLALSIGLFDGFDRASFAIGVILAIVVIRDALGIRRYLGEHGKTLNLLVNDLKDDDVLDKRYPHLLEKIGHSPLQVLVGSIIGLIVTVLGFLIYSI